LVKRFQRKGCFRNRTIRNKNCLWFVSKSLLLWNCFAKTNQNLVGSPTGYGRFCITFPQSRMKGERYRLSSVLSKTNTKYEIQKDLNGLFKSCLILERSKKRLNVPKGWIRNHKTYRKYNGQKN
jgi:hypothetical protein